jgi:hypothetical protein
MYKTFILCKVISIHVKLHDIYKIPQQKDKRPFPFQYMCAWTNWFKCMLCIISRMWCVKHLCLAAVLLTLHANKESRSTTWCCQSIKGPWQEFCTEWQAFFPQSDVAKVSQVCGISSAQNDKSCSCTMWCCQSNMARGSISIQKACSCSTAWCSQCIRYTWQKLAVQSEMMSENRQGNMQPAVNGYAASIRSDTYNIYMPKRALRGGHFYIHIDCMREHETENIPQNTA